MPSFRTQRRVRHSAADMFDLVADVEKYPFFLPLCTGLKVRKRAQDADGRDVLTADMSVGYKAIRETFTSRVTLDRPKLQILVEYIDGPFSKLENRWTFTDMAQQGAAAGGAEPRPSCEIDFFIDYEFRSRMLGMLMGTMFETAFRRFAEAFERRADIVYARRPTVARSPSPGEGAAG
ncbi:MAG: type II toxin-antitoxin system RatA family toxin [Beijerinckiaceae bacterium]|nr:type II toxin-antitoxin system RatA family toxin [Beijerinckiaceae bacterium]